MSNTKTTVKANKIRVNLTLSPESVELGRKLALGENRSFSNTLEVLIERASRASQASVPPAAPVAQEVAA